LKHLNRLRPAALSLESSSAPLRLCGKTGCSPLPGARRGKHAYPFFGFLAIFRTGSGSLRLGDDIMADEGVMDGVGKAL
jgi:hypothetical protein